MAGPFEVGLDRFAQKAQANLDAIASKAVAGIGAELQFRSPVGNPDLWKHAPPKGYVGGTYRHNWQLGVDEVPEGAIARVDGKFPPQSTAAEQARKIPAQAGGHLYFWANCVPWAWPLEYGHSTQAPDGIAGLTAMNWQQIVTTACREVRG